MCLEFRISVIVIYLIFVFWNFRIVRVRAFDEKHREFPELNIAGADSTVVDISIVSVYTRRRHALNGYGCAARIGKRHTDIVIVMQSNLSVPSVLAQVT